MHILCSPRVTQVIGAGQGCKLDQNPQLSENSQGLCPTDTAGDLLRHLLIYENVPNRTNKSRHRFDSQGAVAHVQALGQDRTTFSDQLFPIVTA